MLYMEGWLYHVRHLGLHPDGHGEPVQGSKLQISRVVLAVMWRIV